MIYNNRYEVLGTFVSQKYMGASRYKVDFGRTWTDEVIASSEEEAIAKTFKYSYFWHLEDKAQLKTPVVTLIE